jgi:hypothetical protein
MHVTMATTTDADVSLRHIATVKHSAVIPHAIVLWNYSDHCAIVIRYSYVYN